MKKRIISIASFALIAFATFSCGNRLQNSETTGQIGPDIVIKCDTFKLHEKLLLDNKDKSSHISALILKCPTQELEIRISTTTSTRQLQ